MKQPDRQGLFEVIDSFAIRKRNQFYLIGSIKEGEIEENWFVNVPFNSTLSLTIRIAGIEELEMNAEKEVQTLIIINSDAEMTDLLLDLKIGMEYLPITIEGED